MGKKNYEIAFQFGAHVGGMKNALTSATGMVNAFGASVKDVGKIRTNIGAFSKLQTEIKKNAAALKGMEAGAKKDALREKIAGQQKKLMELRGELKKTGVDLRDLAGEETRLASAADKAKDAQDRLNKALASGGRFKSFASAFAKDTAKAVGILTGATAALVGGGLGLTNAMAADGDNAAKAAAKFGLTSAALQELRYAAGLSGMSVEIFDNNMKTMTINVAKAAKGQGKAVKALQEMGLSAAKLARTPMDQRMMFLADAINKIPDPAKRARAAVALFGSEGLGMLTMFAEGGKGVRAMRDEAIETGVVISNAASKHAEAYDDAKQKMFATFTGIRNALGGELLPVFTDVFGQISTEVISSRGEIQAFSKILASGIRDAVPRIKQVYQGAKSVAKEIHGLTGRVIELVGGFENFGKLAGGALFLRPTLSFGKMGVSAVRLGMDIFGAGKSILGFISAGGGLMKFVMGFGGPALKAFQMARTGIMAMNAALAANPIGAVVAGVAAAAYLIYENWDGIVGYFSEKIDRVKAAFETGWVEGIGALLEEFNPARLIMDAMSGLINYVTGWNVDLWGSIQTAAGSLFTWLSKKFAWVETGLEKIAKGWASFKGFLGFGGDASKAAGGGSPIGPVRDDISPFAIGGVVSRPTLAMVGEGGKPESIIPHDGGSNRALSLWAQTGTALGVGRGATSSSSSGRGGNISVSYSPSITVQGSADKDVILQAFDFSERKLRQMLESLMRDNKRVALA